MQTKNKNVWVFLISQAISILGSSLVQFAIMWYITISTKSGVSMAISIICSFVPTFFLSPFAGVWADKYNKKYLIVLADGFIALSTLIVAAVFLLGHGSIWLLYAVSAVRALGSAVQTPCIGAMLPSLVDEKDLTKYNGTYNSINSFITLLSPMLAGALLGLVNFEFIFFIDVITAVLAIAVMLLFFHMPQQKRTQNEDSNFKTELKEGISYVLKTKYLKSFFVFMIFLYLCAAPVSFLTPVQVARSFGEEPWRLTAIEVAFSAGMLFGGLLMTRWNGFQNKTHTMAFSGVVMAVTTVVMGLPIFFSLYLSQMAICGVALLLFGTISNVLLQENVKPDYLGRVFGVMTMISTSIMPVGMLIFGPLADYFPIELLLVITGVFMLLLSLLLLKNKSLLAVGGKKKETDTQ